MNIILFHPSEIQLPLRPTDPRAQHLLTVLRREPGDTFDAGLINGPRGKGTLVKVTNDSLTLSFTWAETPPSPPPIHLLIGLPRPPTARAILRDATTLGVASMDFIRTEKGEASYASSSLWQDRGWEEFLIVGASQAFCTHLPTVTLRDDLPDALAHLPADAHGIALDNYESPTALSQCPINPASPIALAVGSERGWSANERQLLRDRGFTFAHLGPRVLRAETACLAAITLLRAKLGLL